MPLQNALTMQNRINVWNWLYNDRGEVTDARKFWSCGNGQNPYLRGRTFTYGYDNIGNRTTHSSGGTTAGGTTRTTGYTLNPDGTNEIQAITNPSAFDVTGLASGVVTVGENPVDTVTQEISAIVNVGFGFGCCSFRFRRIWRSRTDDYMGLPPRRWLPPLEDSPQWRGRRRCDHL